VRAFKEWVRAVSESHTAGFCGLDQLTCQNHSAETRDKAGDKSVPVIPGHLENRNYRIAPPATVSLSYRSVLKIFEPINFLSDLKQVDRIFEAIGGTLAPSKPNRRRVWFPTVSLWH